MNSDAMSVAMSMASGSASKYPKDSAENTFEITDHLMEQLGTP